MGSAPPTKYAIALQEQAIDRSRSVGLCPKGHATRTHYAIPLFYSP
ncbi:MULTISPECIES: hypothetical protein [unclassified Moorena]|nr:MULTISPECIES: hypothetical protein [unclassified Moorena]NEP35833.1 hypothetical protein [Moorena sp. SIO3B2]NEQ09477.1 hypothetical protein [Moorena sp. SIO4E2]